MRKKLHGDYIYVATNAIEFGINLLEYARTVPRKALDTKQKQVVTALFKRVVDLTPVDKGQAKGNWKIGVGSPAEGAEYMGGARSSTGEGDFVENSLAAEANSMKQLVKVAGIKGAKIVWISNDTPYITQLEDGTLSRQAPHGMVAVARAEFNV